MNIRQQLHKAVGSFQAGDLDGADEICRKVLKAQRTQPDALHLLGVVALRRGEHQTAADLIERALRRKRDNATYHANLGEAYRCLGRLDSAVAQFERSIDLDPDRAETQCGLGNALLALGRRADAIACFERAIAANPALAEAHYNLGNARSESGDPAGAIADYRRAVEISPSFADAQFNLGNALSIRGELLAAAAAYDAAVRARPDFANGWFNFANALRKLGRLDAAQRAYSNALKLDASLAEARVHLGTIAKLQGRLDAALEELDAALAADPDHALAHAERAHVLLLMDRNDESIAGYRRAVEIEPGFAWAHRGLSGALARAERLAEAESASATAVRLRHRFDRVFLGHDPIGRVGLAKGVEGGHFEHGKGDDMWLRSGMSRIDLSFDQTRFALASVYVDFVPPDRFASLTADCDVIFNCVSDVDSMPRCQEIVQSIARSSPVAFINRPEIAARTTRDGCWQALQGLDGVIHARTVRINVPEDTADGAAALLERTGLALPLLVRRSGTHVADSLEKVDDMARLDEVLSPDTPGEYYLIEFIDYVDERGEYAKMRAMVIDGVLYPNQLWFSRDWLVFGGSKERPRMRATPWMMEKARHFHEDMRGYLGEDAYRALASVHGRLPLDYFGIDFTWLADGRILVFEANATMAIPTRWPDEFDFRRPAIDAMEDAVNRLLEARIRAARDAPS